MPKKSYIFFLYFFLSSIYADQPHDKPEICLIVSDSFLGELEYAYRSKISCDQIGWDAKIFSSNNLEQKDFVHADFILTTVPKKHDFPKANNYLILFDPKHHYFNKDGTLKNEYTNYEGYLITFSDTSLLQNQFANNAQTLRLLKWYPSAQRTPYVEVNPKKLMYICPNWGNRIENYEYKQLYKLLNDTGYCQFYGSDSFRRLYQNSYFGPLPYDGHSIIDKMQKSGVALVVHSDVHIEHGIPSGRIFEALASSAVIISDLNPFVIEHFGDSVLYFDHTQNGKEMFRQIDSHMKWILSHPDEARDLAKRAHEIFDNHFTLDDQFRQLQRFREDN